MSSENDPAPRGQRHHQDPDIDTDMTDAQPPPTSSQPQGRTQQPTPSTSQPPHQQQPQQQQPEPSSDQPSDDPQEGDDQEPQREIQPGPRAARLQALFESVAKRSLDKISKENFAACFPTAAAKAPGTLEFVQRQMVERLGGLWKVCLSHLVLWLLSCFDALVWADGGRCFGSCGDELLEVFVFGGVGTGGGEGWSGMVGEVVEEKQLGDVPG